MSVGFGRRRSVAVPMARRLPRFLGTGLTLGFFALVGGYGMVAGGHWELLRAQQGDPRDLAARALGFGLDRVTISGIAGLSEREILGYAGLSPRASLPFLSVAEIRDRLERVPLIRSASVRKLYPGELAITLVERTPFALWQKNGELNVVAADGAVIDTLRDARLAALPLVVGEGANEKAADFLALLDAAGPLRPRIRAGMLVAGRRWTLKMDNGLDVRLPELGAADAVARLVRLEREQRILDKDVLAVDLRIADRVIVRLSEEAASARAEAVKKRIGRGTKGIDT
jgi:cell division protein FtsQ